MPSERIGIELEVMGYAQAKKQMEDISRLTSTFRGKDAVIPITINGEEKFDTVRNHIKNLRQELRSLQSEQERLQKTLKNADKESDTYQQLAKELDNVNAKMQTAQNTINRLTTASQNAGKSLRTTFNAVSSQVAHLGSAMQSVGNALTRFAMPFQSLMQGTVFGMGYSLLGKVSSGLSSGFERYDTLTKYPRMMESLGYAAEETEASLNKLDKSVRGLPTGLNEIVETAQRFTLSLGDINKGTDLAIATNNAFLASMSTESQQYQGMLQLQDLMNGKDLTSREWMSLGTSMGTAINEIGKYLGYGADQMGDFRAELYAGNIATQDFLDALVAVGTNGGKIEQLAQLSKSTWDAVSRNLGNAFARMTAGVLESLDEISEQLTGKTLVGYLAQDVLPIIDKVTASIKEWIKAHPREISDFFKDLKRLDIKGLLKGYAEGFGSILKMFQGFARFMGGRNLEWLGKFMGMSGFLGRGLTISGGLVKGSRHVVAGLVTGLRALAETLPLFGEGKVLKGIKALLGTGGGASKAGDAVATATAGGGLLPRLISMFKGVATVAGSAAMIGGAGFVVFRSVKTMLKDLSEIIDIASDIEWDKGALALGGMAMFFLTFSKIAGAVGTGAGVSAMFDIGIFGGILTMISGFATLDTWLIKKAMINIKNTAEVLSNTITIVKNMPTAGSLSGLKRSIEAAVTIYETMKFNGNKEGLWSISVGDAKSLKKRITYMNDAIRALSNSVDTVEGLQDVSGIESAKQNLIKMAHAFGDLYNAIEDEFILVTKKEAKKESNVLGSISDMIDSIDHIYDTLRVREWNKPMEGRIDNIKTMFSKITQLYDQLNVDFGGRFGEKSSDRVSSSIEHISSMMDSIDHIYEILRNRDWLKNMNTRIFGITGENGATVGGIKQMFENIKALYDDLSLFFGSDFRVDQSGLVATSLTSLNEIFGSIDSIYAILRDREWNVDTSSKLSGIKNMLNNIQTAMPSLAALGIWNVGDVSGKIDAVTNAVKSIINLNEEAKGLDGVNLSTLSETLKELVPQVQAAAQAMTKGFTEEMDGKEMAKAVKDALERALNATNGYPNKFKARAISIAGVFKNTLQSELSNVSVSTSIAVNITSAIINGAGVVEGAIQGAVDDMRRRRPDLFEMNGGLVAYRAKGGGVGKRRGTDTVRAMLTPGEFVQNKHAVALFGREFMERVNALDINGAMNAMQARLGSRIVSNRTSTVNNVVNNNQRMTQNVYTNNPQFAKIRRTRYTGAL